MAAVLELRSVAKSYPGVRALKGVSLAVDAGRVHALLGENGAGKSTLIKVATGAVQPDAGEILIDGRAVRLTPRSAREAGIRVIHQERQIAWSRSVADNVLLDAPARGRLGLATARAAAREASARLDSVGVDLDVRAPAWTLSVADLQLLELARAVTDDARCIVMDEPTASLHRAEVEQLFRVVRHVRSQGIAVIYISHHLDEVMELADDYTVLRDGAQAAQGSIGEVTTTGLVANIFGSEVSMRPEDIHDGQSHATDEVAIRVAGASYGNAVRDVSVDVHRGEVLVITGAVGCGSRELALLMAGAVRPTAGRVEHMGAAVASRRTAVRRGVGYLPADRKRAGLMLDRSVTDNALLAEVGDWRDWLVNPAAAHRKARGLCDRLVVKVRDCRAAVGGLSGGNQQKVILCRWFNVGSRVLVLDEPTAGIDIPSKVEIYRTLRRRAAEGSAIVVFSTEYQEIRCVADRVLVMRDGRVVGEVSGADATEHRLFELELGEGR